MMNAREWARKHGLTFVWEHDGTITNHVAEFDGYDEEPETCEWVRLVDEEDNVLASLSCIDDADDAYRRTIEADLMEEVAPKESTCGECGRTWFYDTPASRCPFEYDHEPYADEDDDLDAVVDAVREHSGDYIAMVEGLVEEIRDLRSRLGQ